MRTYLFLFLLFIAVAPTAAQDITSVFLSVPEHVLFGLDAQGKDRLVAPQNDSSEVKVRSLLNGTVKRTAITHDFIALETSSLGTLQIKLLPLINDSRIVCVVQTLCGKACDSRISFYTTAWQPLENASLFPVLSIDAFIKPTADRDSEDFKNALAAVDVTFIKLAINSETDSIDALLDIQNYLPEDDCNKIKPYLIDAPLTFKWDRISFK
jgi:hypothetical protein